MEYVYFNGEETELEFLEKINKQWCIILEQDYSETQMLMALGSIFSEVRHRVEELAGD